MHVEDWNQYNKEKELKLEEIKALYDEYERALTETCDVFQKAIYAN